MTQTPYSPPNARVSDPNESRPPKPTSIRRAVICLWTSAAVALAALVLHANIVTNGDVVAGGLSAALLALTAAKLGAGRNWARWLLLVVAGLGSLTFIVVVVLAPQVFLAYPGTVQAVGVIQFGLQISALFLAFTRESRQWLAAST